MKVQMHLLSDTIFGNGTSIPGGEDISILRDEQGFPYYKGSTLKGIFREELRNLCLAKGYEEKQIDQLTAELLGRSGDDVFDQRRLSFSDFTISEAVKVAILGEIGDDPDEVFRTFTHLRTFTAINEDGIVKKGSLRSARCANKNTWYEGEVYCAKEQEELVEEVLAWIKWIGTMRSRGFGKVHFSWKEE